MGCSRPGAIAIGCVLAAGAMSMLSLLLPYWSKMKLDVTTQEHLEVAFGLWGSCINLRPTNQPTLDAPVIMNGTEVIAIEAENIASDLLTCGSYFDEETIRISCTSFRQLASGQCKRHEYFAEGTLCDSKIAVAFLGPDVHPTAVVNWLRFLERACGKTGQASIVFGILSSVSTALGIVLLFCGITCTRIDSWVVRVGAICTAATVVCQVIVAVLWAAETHVIHGEKLAFGTSFYLNIVTIFLQAVAFLAAKKHQRLETEAHEETNADWVVEKQAATTGDDELVAV